MDTSTARPKRVWAWSAGVLLLVVALFIGIHYTAVPTRIGQALAISVEEQTGWRVQFSTVRFIGPASVQLRDVKVYDREDPSIAADFAQVDIGVNVFDLMLGSRDKQVVRSVRLTGGRVHVPFSDAGDWAAMSLLTDGADGERTSSDLETGRAAGLQWPVTIVDGRITEIGPPGKDEREWAVDGAIVLDGISQRVVSVERLSLMQADGDAQLMIDKDGRRGFGRVAVTFDLPGSFIEDMGIDGTWSAARATGEAIVFREKDGRWTVDELIVHTGEGVIVAAGWIHVADPLMDSEVVLSVSGENIRFPEEVPPLAAYGMSGSGSFEGSLSGTPRDLELRGDLRIEDGTVWHRPAAHAVGKMMLGRGRFTFEDAVVHHGDARYDLTGEVVSAVSPVDLQIAVKATKGRVEELLAAFGVEPYVTGETDGLIELHGPVGSLTVSGNLTGQHLSIMGEPIVQSAAGGFTWSDGRLKIGELRARSGAGGLQASGEVDAGHFDVTVELDQWPIEEETARLVQWPDGVGGHVSYVGHVGGPIEDLHVTGQLTDGQLQVGGIHLIGPSGMVAATPDELRVHELFVQSVGQGGYRLNGRITDWLGDAPDLDLTVAVAGASLSSLLEENGLEWPARLIDGHVDGTIEIHGDPRRPDAEFSLVMSDGDLPGGELVDGAMTLQFRLREGRVQLGDWPVSVGRDGIKVDDVSTLLGDGIKLGDLPGLGDLLKGGR